MIPLRAKPPGTRHDASTEQATSAEGDPRLAVYGQAASGARAAESAASLSRRACRHGNTCSPKSLKLVLDYQLILFRDVDLPPATQVAFARNFGEVQIHLLCGYGNRSTGNPICYPTSVATAIPERQASGQRYALLAPFSRAARGVSAPARRR